ncbi:uncharacterized protein CTRU02_215367 [Colletotrichum truncatum]|uniref:Uncharacterized protein n=1 Tax=Colletotrichum truncatum TaxID=5467 RepID=A0ACC3YCZ3_COLTU|nr:uncharacterized protein CTRU02_13324 [Colletotrichum truncatum]KAF6783561.1 hypothetical protein CTRU02_13324 [Colletotrichum truncatum]
MVQIALATAAVLACFAASAQACSGWYQCKNIDGSHCCVIPAQSGGPSDCPTNCNGGSAWPPECIEPITGKGRKACPGYKGGF